MTSTSNSNSSNNIPVSEGSHTSDVNGDGGDRQFLTARTFSNLGDSVNTEVPETTLDQCWCGVKNESDNPSWLRGWISWLTSVDGIVFVAEMCNVMVLSLPVILVPLAVEAEYLLEQSSNNSNNDDDEEMIDSTWIASQVTFISSLAFMGGALGKFVNGFICQAIGPVRCSKIYLVGMACSTAWFSMTHDNSSLGLSFAGMEFFSSVQYAALSVMLVNYYHLPQDEGRLASALTGLGLATTVGDVLAKVVGMALASFLPWRRVAQCGALVALVGTLVISQAPDACQHDPVPQSVPDQIMLTEKADEYHQFSEVDRTNSAASDDTSSYSVLRSLRTVLASAMFWKLAIPYSLVFTACACDRLLVPFYNEMAGLPQSVCGGFTLSITIGLVHGLVRGSEQYATLTTLSQKVAFLRNRHIGNVAAAVGLALLSYYGPVLTNNNTILLTTAAILLTVTMASTLSFQYFQLPCLIAQKYPNDKAVCISFLDGMGFFLSIPIFTALGWIVPEHGWYAGWGFLAFLFATAGTALVRNIPPILDATELYELHHSPNLEDPTDFDPYFYYDWAAKVYTDGAAYATTMASHASIDFQNVLCVVHQGTVC